MTLLLSDDITAEVGTNGDHAHAAGKGRRRLSLARVQGPNTVITAEVAVRAGGFNRNDGTCMFAIANAINIRFIEFCSLFSPGNERKRMRKSAERVEAGPLIHLLSEAETQLWMHKRPWPEGKAKASSALQYTIDGWPLSSGQFWALLQRLLYLH